MPSFLHSRPCLLCYPPACRQGPSGRPSHRPEGLQTAVQPSSSALPASLPPCLLTQASCRRSWQHFQLCVSQRCRPSGQGYGGTFFSCLVGILKRGKKTSSVFCTIAHCLARWLILFKDFIYKWPLSN